MKDLLEHRSYQGFSDLQAMLDLLAAGRQANNGTHYVHRGDLQWWLFYNDDVAQEWRSRVRLWTDAGRLIGWCLLSPFYWHAFDVYVAPALRGSDREREMLAWAVDQLADRPYVQTVWVAEDDDFRVRWLTENGFARQAEFMHLFRRPLTEALSGSPLPEGFHIRASHGPEDARRRAGASHAAFGSSKPFDQYWARTLRFMQSPVYVQEHELFIVEACHITSQEDVAAFCCIWTDEVNRVGYFEPVGVHPAYHRRGLGKSLLLEGLRRLQAEGMNAAEVCANSDSPAAIHLYEAAGFRMVRRLLTFRKEQSGTKTLKFQS